MVITGPHMSVKRSAFFVSDRTGITAEMLGHSLLTQFDQVLFTETTLPFIDTPQKAEQAVKEINQAGVRDGTRPIVISTLVDVEVAGVLTKAEALVLDCFQVFIAPLEQEFGLRSSHAVGRSHSAVNSSYFRRIEAVNYALSYDDGQATKELNNADVILIGVSRCGKTPTCLYLAQRDTDRKSTRLNSSHSSISYAVFCLKKKKKRQKGKICWSAATIHGRTHRPRRIVYLRQSLVMSFGISYHGMVLANRSGHDIIDWLIP